MDEMKEIVQCRCGKKEYYGMMHWHNGRTYCRACIYEIWMKETKYSWKPKEHQYVFPLYEDGKDYTKKDELSAIILKTMFNQKL